MAAKLSPFQDQELHKVVLEYFDADRNWVRLALNDNHQWIRAELSEGRVLWMPLHLAKKHLLIPSKFNTPLNCPGRDPKSHAVFRMIPKKQFLEGPEYVTSSVLAIIGPQDSV
jgi:hypothetical protein